MNREYSEPNDAGGDADRYNDDEPRSPERDPDADYDAKVEAELVAKHWPNTKHTN